MREQIENRLNELRQEFETGQGRLRELEAHRARLSETLLRISGAIQVLEETLAGGEGAEGDDNLQPQSSSAAS